MASFLPLSSMVISCKADKVLFDVGPLEVVAGLLQPSVQLLDKHQGEKAAEDVASDGLISLVENRPRIEDGLHIPEDLLDLPELLVLEGHLLGGKIGVGLEHPLSVKALLFFDLLFVERDGIPIH